MNSTKKFKSNMALQENMHNGEIKVITGIRRCGKSVLLFELFRDHLLENGVSDNQIIVIALDQRRYYKFRNPIILMLVLGTRGLTTGSTIRATLWKTSFTTI